MSYDFFKLPIELQDWFLSNGIQPQSQAGANSTVESFLKTCGLNDFTVKLNAPLKCKDGSYVEEITINKDNLYTAFLPQVWTLLSLEQKLQVISRTYKDIVSSDKTLKHNPPRLAFFDEEDQNFYATYDSATNTVSLKLAKILQMQHTFDIPSFIVHELTHAKQKIDRDALIESNKPIKEMSSREVAIMFQSTGAYMSAFKFFEESDKEMLKEILLGFCNLTEKDIDQIKDNQTSPKAIWTVIFKLPYLCHPMEIEAYRTQNYFRNKMIDSLSEKYEVLEEKHDDEFKRAVDELSNKNNNKCGFNLTDKTLENLVKLNYALGSTVGEDCLYTDEASTIICSGMKTLIDLYNNKEIDDELEYLDYDKLLELKQQQLDKQNHQQDVEIKTK